MVRPKKSIEIIKNFVFPALSSTEWRKTLAISTKLGKSSVLTKMYLNKLLVLGLVEKTEISTGRRISFAWKIAEAKASE